jgi:hypothetical protein
MKKYHLKHLLILLALLFSACYLNPYTPVTGNLSNDVLVGNWKPTDESITSLKKEKSYYQDKEINLILSSDNTFVLTNIPDCFKNAFGECKGGYLSYKGEWKINQRTDSTNDLHLIEKSYNQRGVYAVPLIKSKDTIQIAFFFGDPDSGRAMYFSKR